MGKTKKIFCTLSFIPRAILAPCLYEGPLLKIQKNEFTIQNEEKFTMGSYGVRFDVLGVAEKLVKYVVHSSKYNK
jgi:hypothetical protein